MLEVLAQQLAMVANERSGAENLATAMQSLVASQRELIASQRELIASQRELVEEQRKLFGSPLATARGSGSDQRVSLPASPFADPDGAPTEDRSAPTEVQTTRVQTAWPWNGGN